MACRWSSKVSRELAIDIELFSRGGQEILNAIERQEYAVLGNGVLRFRRPANSRWSRGRPCTNLYEHAWRRSPTPFHAD